MKKSIRNFVICFIVSLVVCGTFLSLNVFAEEDKQYVIDNADFLTDEEEIKLTESIKKVVKKHKCDIVILTEKSITGSSQVYSDNYFDNNDYGVGDDKDGLLLLVTEYENYLSTSGFCIDVYDESRMQDLKSEPIKLINNKDYYNGFDKFITLTDEFITEDALFDWIFAIIGSIVIGFVIAFIITSSMKAKLKSVRKQAAANEYTKADSMNVTESRDFYLYSTITRVAKPKNNSGGTHKSSSGRTHGGGSL